MARRFNQKQAARYDRLAKLYKGSLAYTRSWDGRDKREAATECAHSLALGLAAGWHPHLQLLLTHEHPVLIRNVLRAHGIAADWVLYEPPRKEAMERVYARKVAASTLREMVLSWAQLSEQEEGPMHTWRTEEEAVAAVAA